MSKKYYSICETEIIRKSKDDRAETAKHNEAGGDDFYPRGGTFALVSVYNSKKFAQQNYRPCKAQRYSGSKTERRTSIGLDLETAKIATERCNCKASADMGADSDGVVRRGCAGFYADGHQAAKSIN